MLAGERCNAGCLAIERRVVAGDRAAGPVADGRSAFGWHADRCLLLTATARHPADSRDGDQARNPTRLVRGHELIGDQRWPTMLACIRPIVAKFPVACRVPGAAVLPIVTTVRIAAPAV